MMMMMMMFLFVAEEDETLFQKPGDSVRIDSLKHDFNYGLFL
jgi:hypothetical protein